MEMQSKIMARGDGDRLSDLPDAILVHILSMLWNNKEIVRSSVLSKRWQFLWKSVPISVNFELSFYSEKGFRDFVGSVNRELHYWRSCEKIQKFRVSLYTYKKSYIKDIDLWVHFATKVANVEDFTLEIRFGGDLYEFPQFAYKNTSLRNLDLRGCKLSPPASVNSSRLVSLSIGDLELTDGIMGQVLSSCPNLECLELYSVLGIYRLEISNVRLRKLIIAENMDGKFEILAPYIQHLQLSGLCPDINLQQRNAASLVTAVLYLTAHFEDGEDDLEEECSYFKELLHSVAHVENLELGLWCIQCLSILELKGWKSPPSSRKSLKLNVALEQMDFPGICSFLQSSADLETLVVDWYSRERRDLLSEYTNEVEQSRRFETHTFNSSSLHLKTIKFINYDGPLSGNKSVLPFVKYLLKNAIVLDKFVVAGRFKRSDVSRDYVKMKQEFLSFPRSSPHASIVVSYR